MIWYDMVLHTPFIADLKAIRKQKQELTDKNNEKIESKKSHTYRVCNKELVQDKQANI